MSNKPNEVAPAVFRLGNELFNWYLIKDGDRYTLLDSGLPGYWHQLHQTLNALGGSIDQIEAIILTHAHLDHVGLASRVSQASSAPIYLHAADAGMARWGGAQIPPLGLLINAWRPHPFRILTSAVRRNVFFGPSIRSFQEMADGDRLDLPGCPEILFTPGHTAGSVSVWLPDREVLFAGDALVTIDMLSGRRPQPQLTPRNVGTNRQQSLSSLDRFIGLGKGTLLTGHGDPWAGNLDDAVSMARQLAQ